MTNRVDPGRLFVVLLYLGVSIRTALAVDAMSVGKLLADTVQSTILANILRPQREFPFRCRHADSEYPIGFSTGEVRRVHVGSEVDLSELLERYNIVLLVPLAQLANLITKEDTRNRRPSPLVGLVL